MNHEPSRQNNNQSGQVLSLSSLVSEAELKFDCFFILYPDDRYVLFGFKIEIKNTYQLPNC